MLPLNQFQRDYQRWRHEVKAHEQLWENVPESDYLMIFSLEDNSSTSTSTSTTTTSTANANANANKKANASASSSPEEPQHASSGATMMPVSECACALATAAGPTLERLARIGLELELHVFLENLAGHSSRRVVRSGTSTQSASGAPAQGNSSKHSSRSPSGSSTPSHGPFSSAATATATAAAAIELLKETQHRQKQSQQQHPNRHHTSQLQPLEISPTHIHLFVFIRTPDSLLEKESLRTQISDWLLGASTRLDFSSVLSPERSSSSPIFISSRANTPTPTPINTPNVSRRAEFFSKANESLASADTTATVTSSSSSTSRDVVGSASSAASTAPKSSMILQKISELRTSDTSVSSASSTSNVPSTSSFSTADEAPMSSSSASSSSSSSSSKKPDRPKLSRSKSSIGISLQKTLEKIRLTQAERLRYSFQILERANLAQESESIWLEDTSSDSPGSVSITLKHVATRKLFILHDHKFNQNWMAKWSSKWLLDQDDFTEIRNHFGEEIGFYFAFLNFYFLWLVPPSVAGLVYYVFEYIHFLSGEYALPILGFFIVCWSALMPFFWQRESNALCHLWGVQAGVKQGAEPIRKGFRGEQFKVHPITGALVPHFPGWKYILRQLASIPMVLLGMFIMSAFMAVIFAVEVFFLEFFSGPFKEILSYIPTIIYFFFLPSLTTIYNSFAERLNDWENHRFETVHSAGLYLKLAAWPMLTNYFPVMLIAAVYIPFEKHFEDLFSNFTMVEHERVGIGRLRAQVFNLLVTTQIIDGLSEFVWPHITRWATDLIAPLFARTVQHRSMVATFASRFTGVLNSSAPHSASASHSHHHASSSISSSLPSLPSSPSSSSSSSSSSISKIKTALTSSYSIKSNGQLIHDSGSGRSSPVRSRSGTVYSFNESSNNANHLQDTDITHEFQCRTSAKSKMRIVGDNQDVLSKLRNRFNGKTNSVKYTNESKKVQFDENSVNFEGSDSILSLVKSYEADHNDAVASPLESSSSLTDQHILPSLQLSEQDKNVIDVQYALDELLSSHSIARSVNDEHGEEKLVRLKEAGQSEDHLVAKALEVANDDQEGRHKKDDTINQVHGTDQSQLITADLINNDSDLIATQEMRDRDSIDNDETVTFPPNTDPDPDLTTLEDGDGEINGEDDPQLSSSAGTPLPEESLMVVQDNVKSEVENMLGKSIVPQGQGLTTMALIASVAHGITKAFGRGRNDKKDALKPTHKLRNRIKDMIRSSKINVSNSNKPPTRSHALLAAIFVESKLPSYSVYDPFADTGEDDQGTKGYIHIRIQQRNGRKTLTTIQGLPSDLDLKKLLKAFKKVFACNGTIVEDEELGEVIQLQGDHRTKVQAFLIDEGISKKDEVKIHGF